MKIIQIISADGWKVVYTENGREEWSSLVCFALVEEEDGSRDIEPVEIIGNEMVFWRSQENFLRITKPEKDY